MWQRQLRLASLLVWRLKAWPTGQLNVRTSLCFRWQISCSQSWFSLASLVIKRSPSWSIVREHFWEWGKRGEGTLVWAAYEVSLKQKHENVSDFVTLGQCFNDTLPISCREMFYSNERQERRLAPTAGINEVKVLVKSPEHIGVLWVTFLSWRIQFNEKHKRGKNCWVCTQV